MPKSVNEVILVRNVGKDPEVRYSQSGTPVANFSLATNEQFKDRNDEWQERTEWHNIVAWQRLAEIVGEYVAKGSKVYVEGMFQTTSWEDRQSGERKYRTKVVAQTIAIMGVAKRWQQARTAMVVAECGTGKTLISLGSIHIHGGGSRFTALAMVPPHLVEKWAREAFLTLPGLRVFLIDDLRNGGDENKSHGVNEVRLRQGRIVREGYMQP
jgi:single stranded DNA-binding protein